MNEPIYKICSRLEWEQTSAAGVYNGSAVDRADGFIHFSTSQQLRETARKHFAGQTDLVLITVNPESLGDALQWEPSRGGALFPHLYTGLATSSVVCVDALPWTPHGHVFPQRLSS